MQTIVSQKMSRGQGNELLNKLEAAGLSDELAQRVIDSKGNNLAAKVVRLIQNGGFEPSTSHKQARAIMGKNFFGVEEAIKYFGVDPSKRHLAYLAEIPFTEKMLKSCKGTHVLAAVFPLSIVEMRHKVAYKCFHDKGSNYAFMKDKGEVGWELVLKVPVADSTNKTWNEQQALLGNVEETPKAQVMVYTIIGHFLQTGERLFENIFVRCSDLDSDGLRVSVGGFGAWGLDVNGIWDDDRYGVLGVSAARKQ